MHSLVSVVGSRPFVAPVSLYLFFPDSHPPTPRYELSHVANLVILVSHGHFSCGTESFSHPFYPFFLLTSHFLILLCMVRANSLRTIKQTNANKHKDVRAQTHTYECVCVSLWAIAELLFLCPHCLSFLFFLFFAPGKKKILHLLLLCDNV